MGSNWTDRCEVGDLTYPHFDVMAPKIVMVQKTGVFSSLKSFPLPSLEGRDQFTWNSPVRRVREGQYNTTVLLPEVSGD